MGLSTIEEIYKNPWGVVESRRKEIEAAPFGKFQKILKEEILKAFVPIADACKIIDCSESTARKLLQQSNATYIILGRAFLYNRPDIERIAKIRRESKVKKEKTE